MGLLSELSGLNPASFSTPASVSTAITTALVPVPVWVKYSLTFTSFATAGTANAVTLFSLAAKQNIRDVVIKHGTSFTGGSISAYTISIGIAGTLTKWLGNSNVFTAAGATVFYRPATALVNGIQTFGGATNVVANAISTDDNLDAATTGAVDIYFLVEQLPA